MTEAGRQHLVDELNVLLEAERAGARVGASLVAEARGEPYQALAATIHDDEVKWSRALFEALRELGAQPSDKVGDFYEKAMAVSDFEARLAFTNRGQGWVVRKLRALLPEVESPALKATLEAMLEAHEVNIDAANRALEAAGGAKG